MESFSALSRIKRQYLEKSGAPLTLELFSSCSTEKQRYESALLRQFSSQHARGPRPQGLTPERALFKSSGFL